MPYEEHPNFEFDGNDDSKLWRYMDFTKLASLLFYKALFFSSWRGLLAMDAYEGRPTVADLRIDYALFRKTFIETGKHQDIDELTFHSMIDAQRKFFADPRNVSSYDSYFLSCWHQNQFESDAMWKIYAARGDGIAIQTTFGHLKRAVQVEPTPLYVGSVRYIDTFREITDTADSGFGNLTLLRKTLPYAHEREARIATIMDPGQRYYLFDGEEILLPGPFPETAKSVQGPFVKNPKAGIYVKVDVQVLIERLYISPTAPVWLKALIEEMLDNIKCDLNITPSIYLSPPE